MQYQVPQFIETKTRIIGPFTLEQAGYMIGGGVIEIIIQYTLTGNLKLISTIVVAAIALLLAYGSVGGMRFPTFLFRSLIFILSPKQYLYHKEEVTEQDIVARITSGIPKTKR